MFDQAGVGLKSYYPEPLGQVEGGIFALVKTYILDQVGMGGQDSGGSVHMPTSLPLELLTLSQRIPRLAVKVVEVLGLDKV